MGVWDRVITPLARMNQGAIACGRYTAMVLIGVMTVVILLQVLFRRVLEAPLAWSEEWAIFMMVWMTFLVAPLAYRGGLNVSMDTIAALFRGRWGALLQIVINILVLAMVAVFLYRSFGMVDRGMGARASSANVPMGYIYLIVPLSMVFMITVGIERLLISIRSLIDPSAPAEPDGVETGESAIGWTPTDSDPAGSRQRATDASSDAN